MAQRVSIRWLDEPQTHDYEAAASFLGLLYGRKAVGAIVKKLRKSPMTAFKAKDIFRASGLSLLGVSNSHVIKDKKKILSKQPLSPILLVRNEGCARAIIADGYHRMCAVYYFNEDAVIPCQIV
ncbi:MAG: hypothetical protein KGJ09_08765 [Candidatus Omnitrophica bacterium]|nr:hypothetical protein [Candidatus Omnitrophota bacterium]MDE2010151.1 hypothetical protein [Candidatus Omnitrophota bacterium]MDE2214884.1 hypothetical protein [Candidatus Omnitrophota bacterium]MDE2230785.1 hypothetical protein [Candidatus Omnitrophota bacterium]